MTTRSYQTTKRNARRSRRIARQTDLLIASRNGSHYGDLINRISCVA